MPKQVPELGAGASGKFMSKGNRTWAIGVHEHRRDNACQIRRQQAALKPAVELGLIRDYPRPLGCDDLAFLAAQVRLRLIADTGGRCRTFASAIVESFASGRGGRLRRPAHRRFR